MIENSGTLSRVQRDRMSLSVKASDWKPAAVTDEISIDKECVIKDQRGQKVGPADGAGLSSKGQEGNNIEW